MMLSPSTKKGSCANLKGRYSRQERHAAIGKKGQALLGKKRVCIVGIGGLGTIASEMLARAGTGTLILIDDDAVELSNLQRQTLFSEKDIGQKKALAAAEKLRQINSCIDIIPVCARLSKKTLGLLESDIVLDCTDNIRTRQLIDLHCRKNSIPWIFCTVGSHTGYAKLFDKDDKKFADIYKKPLKAIDSSTRGIINPITHMAASLQVSLALQYLLGKRCTADLIFFDAWNIDIRKIKL